MFATSTTASCVNSVAVEMDGHLHGHGCGHKLVRHDDHFDYVGDDGELHHLVESCCEAHAGQGPVFISHGSITQLKRRKPGMPSPSAPTRLAEADCTEPLVVPDNDAYTITKIYCEGVCCPMEVPVVNNVLNKLPGIYRVDVAVVTKTVTVKHVSAVISPAAMVAALDEARLGASLTFPREQTHGTRSWVPPTHVLVAAALLVISLFHYLSTVSEALSWMEYLKWVALGSVAICLPGILLKALGALRHGVLDIHALLSIAVAGAIAIGDYTEAGVVCVLFAIADFLETRCAGQARDAIAAVLALKPETALVLSRTTTPSLSYNNAQPNSPGAPGDEHQNLITHSAVDHDTVVVDEGLAPVEMPAANVKVGSLILIRPGDKAPLDGVLVSGHSAFDESMLTGESVPVEKHAGDVVRAGTLNAGSGAVQVRTSVTSEETVVAGMARLVEQATSRQSPSETAVARFAKIYTPLVVLGCLLLAFVPWATCPPDERKDWVYLALQVLVTACPCALVLSTPATVVSALARAAQAGVLIKGGIVLETLGKVDTVTLDKTGTITRGSFLLSHFELTSACRYTEQQVLRLVGSLERGSGHPLAAAIVGRAAARGASCDAHVDHSAVVPGCGIEGSVEGAYIVAGTFEMLTGKGVDNEDELITAKKSLENTGSTTCYIAIDNTFVASIGAKDVLRSEVSEAISALHVQGIMVAILTGDNKSVALDVAQAAGIAPELVHAGLMPQDKLELVASYKAERAKQKHKVAHVGDGINDAPALASADVGIAMGVAGAAAALEAGDVCLFTNDLRMVAALHRLARAAARRIAFNIGISVVTKVAVLALAATRHFTLWAAVLVDVGTALLVTFNGLGLLRFDFGLGGTEIVCIGAQATASGQANNKNCCSNGQCSGHTAVVAKSGCTTGCGDVHVHKHSHKHEHGSGGARGCCGSQACSSNHTVELVTKKSCCVDAAEKSQPCCGSKHEHIHDGAAQCCGSASDGACGSHTVAEQHFHNDPQETHSHHHHHHHHANGGCCGGMESTIITLDRN